MKKVLIGILVIIFIIVAFIGGKWFVSYINDNTKPIIYYSFNDNPNLPLTEDNGIYSNNMTIVWTDNCHGVIKKDGEIISKVNGTLLSEDGTYEITAKSPSGKNKILKTFKLDKGILKPNIEITEKGYYVFTAEDKIGNVTDGIEFSIE